VQARNLSVSLFSLLEGSFILARATRDHTHVRTAGRAASDAVRAALEKRSTRRGGPGAAVTRSCQPAWRARAFNELRRMET
jgi:hypothetical protein